MRGQVLLFPAPGSIATQRLFPARVDELPEHITIVRLVATSNIDDPAIAAASSLGGVPSCRLCWLH
jgi:hypothetical protein